MIAKYKPNEKDDLILQDLTTKVKDSLTEWYGEQASLDSDEPTIRSYRNSFMLRYSITTSTGHRKVVLVKIRRNPKMASLTQAVEADLHQNIPSEYQSLTFVYNYMTRRQEDFSAIRPLMYYEKYFAIFMEEVPSRTLRQLLRRQRSSNNGNMHELKDAARKTGRWLHFFHNHIHSPSEQGYTTGSILQEVQAYADQIESCSHGRVRAGVIVDAFSEKLENIPLERITFSQSHADMTCDNVLYTDEKKICIIDIKTRLAPIYSDLGLILIHPETSKPQIFSSGTYYPESLLRQYRADIVAGYFEEGPGAEELVRVYSAVQVLDKWLMYENLMSKYKGIKHYLSLPVGPFVSGYFQKLLKKHLDLIEEPGQAIKLADAADRAA